MALKRFNQAPMVVLLGKFDKEGTSIMRKATNIRLSMSDANNQGMIGAPMGGQPNAINIPSGSAIITLDVQQFYVAEGGGYGAPVTGNGMVPSYTVTISATGQDYIQVVLDAEGKIDLQAENTGKFLKPVREATIQDAEQGGVLDVDYMYDSEFFRKLSYENLIVVMPILQKFILDFKERGGFDIK